MLAAQLCVLFPLAFTGSMDNICIECLDNTLKQLLVITYNATSNHLFTEVSTACKPSPEPLSVIAV